MVLSSLRHTQDGPPVLLVQMQITRAPISPPVVAARAARNRDSVFGRMNVKDFPNYVLVFGGRPDSAIYAQVGTFHITIIKWTFRTIFNFGRRRGASKDARQQVCRGVSKEPAPTSSR